MTEKELKFFTDIIFSPIEAAGRTFRTPFLYYDFSRITATFPAPISRVTESIPSKRLRPVEIKPNTTMVTLVAYEYRKMEGIHPYNEFGVSIPTVHVENDLPGLFVTHLPVTTEQSRSGGVDIYGFPKFIADITFEDEEELCRSEVRLDGKDIVSLEVRKMDTEMKSNDFYAFTIKDEKILRTYVQAQGFIGTGNEKDGAVFRLGNHPIADEIKSLGMKEMPLEFSYSPMMQSLLHKPGEILSM